MFTRSAVRLRVWDVSAETHPTRRRAMRKTDRPVARVEDGGAGRRPMLPMKHEPVGGDATDYRYKVWRTDKSKADPAVADETPEETRVRKDREGLEALVSTTKEMFAHTDFDHKRAKELGFRMMKVMPDILTRMLQRRAEDHPLGNSLWLSRRVAPAPYYRELYKTKASEFLAACKAEGWEIGELPIAMAMRRAALMADIDDAKAVFALAEEHSCVTKGMLCVYASCYIIDGDYEGAKAVLRRMPTAPGALFKNDKVFICDMLHMRRGLHKEDAAQCRLLALFLMDAMDFQKEVHPIRRLASLAASFEESVEFMKRLGRAVPQAAAECAAELGDVKSIEPMLKKGGLKPKDALWMYFGAFMEAEAGRYTLDDLLEGWLRAKRVYGHAAPGQEAFEAYINALLVYAKRAPDEETRDEFIQEMESKFSAFVLKANNFTQTEARNRAQRRATSKVMYENMAEAYALQGDAEKARWLLDLTGGMARSTRTKRHIDDAVQGGVSTSASASLPSAASA